MHFRLELIAVADDGGEERQELADLERGEAAIGTLGLTLDESKQLLAALQRAIVERQAADYLDEQRPCPHCGRRRPLKEQGDAPFRTLFGLVSLPNPRWQHCGCCPSSGSTGAPAAPARCSAAARLSGQTAALLASKAPFRDGFG